MVNETDDGATIFEDLVRGFGPVGTIAVEPRTWAETVIALGGRATPRSSAACR